MTTTVNRQVEQRAYLLKIKDILALPPLDDRPSFDDCSSMEQKAIAALEQMIRSGANRNALERTYDSYQKKQLKRILAEQSPTIEITRSEDIVPPLGWGMLPKDLAGQTGAWFREYEQFSTNWSRRAYQLHHTGTAIWLASTVAGGRIAANYAGYQCTPFYVAIVSPSSAYAKTTTIKIAEDTLHKAGLNWRLASNAGSPEKLLSNMAGKFVPTNWNDMRAEDQEAERLRLAHSGQIGWYYSEFGEMLRDMANKTGRNAGYKSILLRMDDGEQYFDYDTISRGRERIERPYLALIGTMTPENMKDYTSSDASSWGDGTYARFAFCCPPAGAKKTRETLLKERHPGGDRIIPSSIITPLRNWHNRLGERECKIIEEKGKPVIQLGELPLTRYNFGLGVQDALEDYGDALILLAQHLDLKQFNSSYTRLKDKALRIATLAASLEGSSTIELCHIAFGQHIAEEFRASLHHLAIHIKQTNTSGSERLQEEDEIIQYVARSSTWLTVRLLHKNKFKDTDRDQLTSMVIGLTKSGELINKKDGKTEYYTVPGAEWKPLSGSCNGGDKS